MVNEGVPNIMFIKLSTKIREMSQQMNTLLKGDLVMLVHIHGHLVVTLSPRHVYSQTIWTGKHYTDAHVERSMAFDRCKKRSRRICRSAIDSVCRRDPIAAVKSNMGQQPRISCSKRN